MKQNLLQTIKKSSKQLAKLVDKHSPEILIGCGIVGFVSTCVMVADEAPRAKEKLDELHKELAEREEEPTKGEIIFEEVKAVAPIYAPAIVSGAVSTACILGSYKISTKRTAAYATAYELTQSQFLTYKDKVKTAIGERKEKKLTNDISQEQIDKNPPPKALTQSSEVIMGDGLSLFYDPLGGRYFRSNIETVRKAEKAISDRLTVEMYVNLNELYYELGIPYTKIGDMVGFTVSDGIEIMFNSCLAPDMTPCTVMEFLVPPQPDGRWY